MEPKARMRSHRIRRIATCRRRSHGRHLFNVIRHRITRSNERTRKTGQIRRSTNGPTNVTSQDARRCTKTKTRTINGAPLLKTLTQVGTRQTNNKNDTEKEENNAKRHENENGGRTANTITRGRKKRDHDEKERAIDENE